MTDTPNEKGIQYAVLPSSFHQQALRSRHHFFVERLIGTFVVLNKMDPSDGNASIILSWQAKSRSAELFDPI
jgi:hypothetical protein